MAADTTKLTEMLKYSPIEDKRELGRRGINVGNLTAAQIEEAYKLWSYGWSIVAALENAIQSESKQVRHPIQSYDEWFAGLTEDEQYEEMMAYTE